MDETTKILLKMHLLFGNYLIDLGARWIAIDYDGECCSFYIKPTSDGRTEWIWDELVVDYLGFIKFDIDYDNSLITIKELFDE